MSKPPPAFWQDPEGVEGEPVDDDAPADVPAEGPDSGLEDTPPAEGDEIPSG